MSLILATPMQNAIAAAVTAQIGATGTLEFQTGVSAVVATLTLSNPAFGAPASGVITMAGAPKSATSGPGGVMSQFLIKASSTTQITGTVGVSASDINFAGGVTVGAGDTVELTSFTITCPAS
jgi:hypothetical protein